jgi:hypothetical protein
MDPRLTCRPNRKEYARSKALMWPFPGEKMSLSQGLELTDWNEEGPVMTVTRIISDYIIISLYIYIRYSYVDIVRYYWILLDII